MKEDIIQSHGMTYDELVAWKFIYFSDEKIKWPHSTSDFRIEVDGVHYKKLHICPPISVWKVSRGLAVSFHDPDDYYHITIFPMSLIYKRRRVKIIGSLLSSGFKFGQPFLKTRYLVFEYFYELATSLTRDDERDQ